MRLSTLVHTLTLSVLTDLIVCQVYTGPEDPRVIPTLSLETPCNGVSLTPDGRIFLVYQRVDGSKGPTMVEYDRTTNKSTAYPNEAWNNYTAGADPSKHFLGVNAQRIGPDGNLYVIDTGQVGGAGPVHFPDGPKVVVINVTTNEVTRIYKMGDALASSSHLDDMRFHQATDRAYLTDAGYPGLIVMNLTSGEVRRVLTNDMSTRGFMPVSADGHILYQNGKPSYTYADQLEVSPDGKYLYYQPPSGGMSRIETKYLDLAFTNSTWNDNSILDQYIEPFATTPETGGTAIDADGNIYNSDLNSRRVIKISPNGTMTLLAEDPRFLWIDAMWIDANHTLWMPSVQLNRGVAYNNGKSHITYPLDVFTIKIGAGPPAIDHA